MELVVRNVNEAYSKGMRLLHEAGEPSSSRAGDVLVLPYPVTTIYQQPMERVLFHSGRDANPWFHIMEAMWMLLGRNDVDFLTTYNKRMTTYSDDGITLRGAYGHRWRHYFNRDQVREVIRMLRGDMNTRRAVIEMWDARDLSPALDVPCNTHIYLRVLHHRLDLTVMCRSNDIIWGAYGANAVHFSVLQEYIAANVGLEMGQLYQYSNNYHAYKDIFEEKWASIHQDLLDYDPGLEATRIVTHPTNFTEELHLTIGLIEEEEFKAQPMDNPFMNTLLAMGGAWNHYKHGDLLAAIRMVGEIPAQDWRLACQQWLVRRGTKNVQRQHLSA
jgi:hypothetical protein